jgi:hypothetical protein
MAVRNIFDINKRISKKFKINLLFFLLFLTFFSEIMISSNQKIFLHGYKIITGISLFLILYQGRVRKQALVFFAVILFWSGFYIFIHPNFLYSIKFIFYLIPVFFIVTNYSIEDFCQVLVKVIEIYILMSFILFCIGIGVDRGYGLPRMQGLLSEPSAMALPLPLLFLSFFNAKKYFKLIVLLPCIFLTQSPTVYIVTFLSLLLYFFINSKKYTKIILIGFIILIFSNILNLLEILYLITNNHSISRLQRGIESISSFGTSGYNPRMRGMLVFFDDILANKLYFLFGGGLDSISVINSQRELSDMAFNNIPVQVFTSFGITGFIVFICLVFLMLDFYSRRRFIMTIIIPVVIYTSINSAMGIQLQYLLFVLMVFMLRDRDNIRLI